MEPEDVSRIFKGQCKDCKGNCPSSKEISFESFTELRKAIDENALPRDRELTICFEPEDTYYS